MARKQKIHIIDDKTLKEQKGNAFWWGAALVIVIVAIAMSM